LKLLFPNINIPAAKWYKHYPWIAGAGYWKPHYDRENVLTQIIKPIRNENIFICGENYSSHQAWVEGALETSDLVLNHLTKITNPLKNTLTHSTIRKHTHTHTHKHTKTIHNGGRRKSTNPFSTAGVPSNFGIPVLLMDDMNYDNAMLYGGSKKYKTYKMEEVAKHNTKADAWLVINKKVINVTNWINKHPGGDIIMKGVGKDATKLFNGIGHSSEARKLLTKFQIGILE
jgi:cytochrome b involved in lipid metabolism